MTAGTVACFCNVEENRVKESFNGSRRCRDHDGYDDDNNDDNDDDDDDEDRASHLYFGN